MKKLNKNEWVAVCAGLGFVAYLFYGNLFMGLINPPAAANTAQNQITTGYEKQDLVAGQGDIVAAGDTLTVNYVGMLPDGKVFDSSIDRNAPYTFLIGTGQVIKGWDQGIIGMRVGGKRRLIIAPDYAYGPNGYGAVPANTPIIFEIELLQVQKPSAQ
jgi:FKBP-type peptidyl-prolyl cis-trans isomerase